MVSGTTEGMKGVCGSGPFDAFAVGWSGTIVHYDGAAWEPMALGTTAWWFNGVWGSGPDDVFAVGNDG